MTDKSDKKGFSGLSSLASDVDDAPQQESSKQQERKPGGDASGAHEARSNRQETAPRVAPASKSQREPEVVASSSSQGSGTGSSGAKWFWGLVGIGVLIWLFNAAQEDGSRSTGNRSYSPTASSPSYTPSTPAPSQLAALEFSKPPVGRNNVLSVAQIRWCLREGIRIETLRSLTTTNAKVDQFNAIVVNHNSRCGSFRYRRGTLERARREVEQMRSQIVAGVRGGPLRR